MPSKGTGTNPRIGMSTDAVSKIIPKSTAANDNGSAVSAFKYPVEPGSGIIPNGDLAQGATPKIQPKVATDHVPKSDMASVMEQFSSFRFDF